MDVKILPIFIIDVLSFEDFLKELPGTLILMECTHRACGDRPRAEW